MAVTTSTEPGELIAGERLRFADWLAELEPEDWERGSLCAGWTVADVVGHMTFPWRVSTLRLLGQMARHRGFHEAARVGASSLAAIGPDALAREIHDHAADLSRPPGAAAEDLLAEIIVHPLDIARPNRLTWTVAPAALPSMLDFLTTSKKAPAYHPRGGIDGIRWVASDVGWSWGAGPEVVGAGQDLVLALANRPAAVDRLSGTGIEALRDALSA